MTAFARKVLAGLPDHEPAGDDEQLHDRCRSSRTDTDKAGGKVDVQLDAGAVAVRPLRLPRSHDRSISRTSRCHPAAPATAHLRAQQAVRRSASTWAPTARSLLEVRFGYSWTQAGKNPPALGSDSALDAVRPPRAADRPPHCRRPADAVDHRLLGSRTAGDQPAVAVPDRLQPEGQLHVDGRRALAQDRLRVPADQHRSAGRQPALRPRHLQRPVHAPGRRGGRATSTTSPTSCSACARSTRSATSSSPTCARTCTSPTCRTTGARRAG